MMNVTEIKNIIIAAIIGISLIISASMVSSRRSTKEKSQTPLPSKIGRYEIIISNDQSGKPITIESVAQL